MRLILLPTSGFVALRYTMGAFLLVTLINTAAVGQTIFQDDLNDNVAGWTFESLSTNFGITDGADALFGFDYSAFGIPEAPNSDAGDAATAGLRIRANNTGASTGQAATFLDNASFAGQYTVQVDMWLNWSADESLIGTTEHGGLFVGNRAANDPPPTPNFQPVQRGAGAIFSTDSDCLNCDHILLKNLHELDTFSGQYSVQDFGSGNQPGYDDTDVNTNPANGDLLNLATVFPSFNISAATGGAQGTPVDLEQTAGAVGFQWVTLTAEVDPTAAGNGPGPGVGTAKFTVTNAASGQSYVLGTVDNSRPDILDDDNDGDECDGTPGSEDICINKDDPLAGDLPVDLEGRISLIMIDFFSGRPASLDQGFALFDNVIVSTTAAAFDSDFDGDGDVDAADLTIWETNFGLVDGTANQSLGDASGDGNVTGTDYLIWQRELGLGTVAAASSVPEPTSLALILVAILAVTGRRRL